MKKKKLGFTIKLIFSFVVILSIFVSGYLSLDKLIIPNNFGSYNIKSVGDLASVISSLYGVPKQKKQASASFDEIDFDNAISKLQGKGYKIENDGVIKNENFLNFKGSGIVTLNDNEIASILKILYKNGVTKNYYSTFEYIGVENIEILNFKTTPQNNSFDPNTQSYSKANVNLTIKVNTEKLKKQIAVIMETTEALLKLILPDTIYFDINFNADLNSSNIVSDNKILVNDHTIEKSDRLINLLIEFIYSDSEEMNYDKFSKSLSDIAIQGIYALGNFRFVKNINDFLSGGVIVNI